MGKTDADARRAKRKPAKSAAATDDNGELPVDYMLRVMRDPKATPSRRDIMAKSATPYVHAKPPAKKKSGRGGDASLKRRLETARETLARKIARLESDEA